MRLLVWLMSLLLLVMLAPAAAFADDIEPNNAFSTAQPLQLGGCVEGNFWNDQPAPPWEDYYYVNSLGAGVLRAQVSDVGQQVCLSLDVVAGDQVTLLDPSGRWSEIGNYSQGVDMDVYLPAAGKYFIKVRGMGSCNGRTTPGQNRSYKLCPTFTPVKPVDETEPNNDEASADAVPTGREFKANFGEVGAVNVDYFKFTLPQQSQVRFSVKNVAGSVCVNAEIHPAGSATIFSEKGGYGTGLQTDMNLSAGDYYVRLEAYEDNCSGTKSGLLTAHKTEPYSVSIAIIPAANTSTTNQTPVIPFLPQNNTPPANQSGPGTTGTNQSGTGTGTKEGGMCPTGLVLLGALGLVFLRAN